MAIDSALKRRAVAGISNYIHPSVTPDVTKPVGWRQSVAWGYLGISPITPVVSAFWNAMTGESGFTGGGDIEEWLRSIIPFIILVNYVL